MTPAVHAAIGCSGSGPRTRVGPGGGWPRTYLFQNKAVARLTRLAYSKACINLNGRHSEVTSRLENLA